MLNVLETISFVIFISVYPSIASEEYTPLHNLWNMVTIYGIHTRDASLAFVVLQKRKTIYLRMDRISVNKMPSLKNEPTFNYTETQKNILQNKVILHWTRQYHQRPYLKNCMTDIPRRIAYKYILKLLYIVRSV